MAIDHEAHKIRIKAVSDRMSHPMTYNDAGAPRMDAADQHMHEDGKEEYRKMRRDGRLRNMITGGK
jgi:hypothetical protein